MDKLHGWSCLLRTAVCETYNGSLTFTHSHTSTSHTRSHTAASALSAVIVHFVPGAPIQWVGVSVYIYAPPPSPPPPPLATHTGCTNTAANNFGSIASSDDGSCQIWAPTSCTNGAEFNSATTIINAVWCSDTARPCVSGMPTTCTTYCYTVLQPVATVCRDFLVSNALNGVVLQALALCSGGGGGH
jgi:hypothetical protein